MIEAADLTEMRTDAEQLFDKTCMVRRVTNVADLRGGFTRSTTELGPFDCRLSPGGGGPERELASRTGSVDVWTVTLPALTDVRLTDVIQIDGRTFEVGSVDAPRSYEITRRVHCTEVR